MDHQAKEGDPANCGIGVQEPEPVQHAEWKELFNFTTRTHIPYLAIGLCLSVITGMIIPALALFLGDIFDDFTSFDAGTIDGADLVGYVSTKALWLLWLGLASWILNASYFMFWLSFGELQARSVRDQLFEGMLQRDMEWFDMRKAGVHATIARFQTQIYEVQNATSQPLGFAAQYTVTFIAALGLAFYTAWNLTLVTIAAAPFISIILACLSARMQRNIDSQTVYLTNASKLASNAIIAIDTVKTFNGQDHEVRQYIEALKRAALSYLKVAQGNALQIGIIRATVLGMFVQGFWYGTYLVAVGDKTAGQVLTAFWGCLMAIQIIEQLSPQMIVLEKGKLASASLKTILGKVEGCRKVTKMFGGKVPRFCDGEIQITKLSFAYPSMPEQLVLDGANFFFPAGELTFVMGRSGSGKSTLANLLLQFYHPASGEILIDGESTRGLDTNWLRNNITLVQQDNVLFNETIFENIALGRHDQERVSLEEVNACVDAAKLEDTLHNLSDGLHTRVGMNGSHLSGGQRQRIAIARARLRDTPVLILDEATSALDQASRMVIMESIREWRNGKTTIVITHDTSQIQDGEYVYILDKGQVIQEGYRNSLQDETGSQLEVLLHLGPVLQSPRPQSPTETEQRRSLILPSTIENTVEDWLRQSCHFEDPIATQIPIQETFLLSPDTVAPGDLRSQRYTTDVLAMFSAMASSADQGSTPRMSTIPLIPKRPDRIYHTSGIELDDLEPAWEKSMRQTFSTVKPPRVVSQQPALKNVKITKPSRLQVCLSFLGISRVASKSERPLASLASILSTVWPRLSRHQRLLLVLGFTAASIHAAATPVFSWVFANLLGTFYLSSGQVQQALIWSLSILAVALADASASYFMHYFLEMTGQAWVDSLRIEALKRILDQPKSWFDLDDNNLSMIAECLDRNAEEMRNLVGRFTGFAYVAATMLIISIFWSMAVCWKLTLVGLVTAPVIYGITKGFEAVSGKWESKRNDVGEAIGAIFHETFINISTVRALAVEDYFHKRLAAATRQALNGGLKRATFSGIFFGLADSSIIFATALIFYYGSVLAASGAWSAQDILTVFSLLLFGIANVNAVVGYIPQVNSSRDTASRLLRLASLPLGSSDEYTGTLRLSYLPGPLRFASITSTYPLRPALPVLDSLTLDIPLSSSTAIVGPSGCGKSTIVSLLLRLYPVDPSTALTVGSTPISELHLPSWRDLVAAVFQKSTIFPATIAENIAYPQSRLTEHGKMESIVGAASLAGIHTFIESLPLGYNTPIGDGGTGLSGGQVQRIGIARALIRKPQLLIMDEPTSALDSESAEGVRGVIADLVRQGVTVVVMTHSWEMMKVCGRVVVLGNGKVVEQGIYDELMRKSAGPLKDLLGGEGSGVQALEEVIEQD